MAAPRPPAGHRPTQARNGRVAWALAGLTAVMIGASFAAVPFYRWFCATTGYGGTPTVASVKPADAPGRPIEVRFDTNVHAGLPWRFEPETPAVTVALGEATTVLFRITNTTNRTTRGQAAFNVTPPLAAYYFTKLACFCFTEQTLAPGETIEAPVTFWVDGGLDGDKNVAGLSSLTLSYTFFATPDEPKAAARVTEPPTTRLQ
ncbi:MAG: cytochrome c oxidase assembly protein [Hyphomicrobiales bacterium]|nr:cytochrome c oxidase assembly protein [Hyphomicrobiales bacterium]